MFNLILAYVTDTENINIYLENILVFPALHLVATFMFESNSRCSVYNDEWRVWQHSCIYTALHEQNFALSS